jgi:signal transduction histidine kinase
MNILEILESLVSAYKSRLYDDPEAKHDSLDLADLSAKIDGSDSELLEALTLLWDRERTILGKFAVAKHGLELCCGAHFSRGADLIPQWLFACVEAGAYEDCIRFSDGCLESNVIGEDSIDDRFSVLRSRAKSLRNLGRLQDAQNCYREILSLAHEVRDNSVISVGLLLIGKLYGNYWGQLTLFSSFVEEAKARLEEELDAASLLPDQTAQVKRRLAICHDALGQAYRDSEPAKVEKHFLEAVRLNQELGRSSGVSRSLCHLNYLKFKHSAPEEQTTYLQGFNDGIKMLLGENADERGLGIRYTQYASMLLKTGAPQLAERYLKSGKYYAQRYSEYKTLTRAALVEASLFRTSQPERAILALEEGLSIARKFGLQIQESEINLQLAELANCEVPTRLGASEIQVTELLKRNREIYVGLINEAKGSLTKLNSANELPWEFALLSSPTRTTFRERLLLDFDRAVNQLDLNLEALVTTLSLNERKRRELVVLEVVNSVARLLLHEYKTVILANKALTPIQQIAAELNRLAQEVDNIKVIAEPSQANEKLEEMRTSLKKRAERLKSLGGELGRMKILLTERLRRPQHLEDRISLQNVISKAILELQQQNPATKTLITFNHPCDIRLFFSQDLMITVIQNLIRNAIEALGDEVGPENKIVVSLGWDSDGDSKYGNPSVAANLSIVTLLRPDQSSSAIAKAIQVGLESSASSKAFGSGVGMDITKLIFRDLMGAVIHVLEGDHNAGIRIVFKTDPMNAELVYH